MARHDARRRLRPRRNAGVVYPEMNVTPLVDVVLVLLIIFMVVAPRMEQDVAVDLPALLHPDPQSKGVLDPLRVSIPAAGELYFEGERFDLPQLVERLNSEHSQAPDRRLLLRADARLTYGDVRPLLEKTQAIGFPGFSFVVGEAQADAAERAQRWQ